MSIVEPQQDRRRGFFTCQDKKKAKHTKKVSASNSGGSDRPTGDRTFTASDEEDPFFKHHQQDEGDDEDNKDYYEDTDDDIIAKSSTSGSIDTPIKFIGNPRAKEAEQIDIPQVHDSKHFRKWKQNLRELVANASVYPDKAFQWIFKVEKAKSWEELEKQGFANLSRGLAIALSQIINGDLQAKIAVPKDKPASKGKMLNGPQYAWLIFDHYRISDMHRKVVHLEECLKLEIRKNNIGEYVSRFDSMLLRMDPKLSAALKGTLLRKQMERLPALRTVINHYNHGIHFEGKSASYDSLRKLVDIFLEK